MRNWKHSEKIKTQWETENTVRNCKHSEKLKHSDKLSKLSEDTIIPQYTNKVKVVTVVPLVTVPNGNL